MHQQPRSRKTPPASKQEQGTYFPFKLADSFVSRLQLRCNRCKAPGQQEDIGRRAAAQSQQLIGRNAAEISCQSDSFV